MLTIPELNTAKSLLRQARALVAGVQSLFFNVGDAAAAARLKDIDGRLEDEVRAIERLIAAAPQGGQP